MTVYHRYPHLIQLTSHPDRIMMPRNAGVRDWCFSHLPEAHCFISHYCANSKSKQLLYHTHQINQTALDSTHLRYQNNFDIDIHLLTMF